MSNPCLFCRIVGGEIPSTRVYETEEVLAFRDIHPQAPMHILVVPRLHVAGLTDLPGIDSTWNALIAAVQRITASEGLDDGFRVVVNQGELGGQTVPHLHLHLLSGRHLHWPPG